MPDDLAVASFFPAGRLNAFTFFLLLQTSSPLSPGYDSSLFATVATGAANSIFIHCNICGTLVVPHL